MVGTVGELDRVLLETLLGLELLRVAQRADREPKLAHVVSVDVNRRREFLTRLVSVNNFITVYTLFKSWLFENVLWRFFHVKNAGLPVLM